MVINYLLTGMIQVRGPGGAPVDHPPMTSSSMSWYLPPSEPRKKKPAVTTSFPLNPGYSIGTLIMIHCTPHTVDGRNPAPWDVQNHVNNGINYLSTGAGFQPSTVWLGIPKATSFCFSLQKSTVNGIDPLILSKNRRLQSFHEPVNVYRT